MVKEICGSLCTQPSRPFRIVDFFSPCQPGAGTPASMVHRPYSKTFQMLAGPGGIELCQVSPTRRAQGHLALPALSGGQCAEVLPSMRCGSSQWRVLSGGAEAFLEQNLMHSVYKQINGIAAQMMPQRPVEHNGVTFRTVNVRSYKRSIPRVDCHAAQGRGLGQLKPWVQSPAQGGGTQQKPSSSGYLDLNCCCL